MHWITGLAMEDLVNENQRLVESPELLKANFAGADLRGADLSFMEEITPERLQGAILDETTLMPPGLEHLVREVPPFPATL